MVMDMVMMTGVVTTVVIAMLLMHLVMRFVTMGVRGGEGRGIAEGDGGVGVVGVGGGDRRRRRSEKRVRFDFVEQKYVVVDRFEGVEERRGSAAVVEGFGKVVEDVGGDAEVSENGVLEVKSVGSDCGGGVVGRDEPALEEKLEVEDRCFQFEDILESREVDGSNEVEEIGGVADERERGSASLPVVDESGVGFVNENVVCSGLNEVECSADNVGGETQAVDVEDTEAGGEGTEKELKDEVAERIEECIRNIEGGLIEAEDTVNKGCENECEEMENPKDVADMIGGVTVEENSANEGCKNEIEETAEHKDVADMIGGVTVEENSANEGCKNDIEETAEHKDVADQIGVTEEENSVNEGYKNEFERKEESKDLNVEIKKEVMEERFGSSEEDDDWEGIEVSELYKDFTAAAAFVRKEEKDGKLIGGEVKMHLYGLQKIIIEGPCREAQPMAIKMSARAKWNAWQRLGNMNPEDAMKQYIALVSGLNPEWAEQNAGVDDQSENVEAKKLSISDPEQLKPQNESQTKKELPCNTEGIDTGCSSL